MAYYDHPSISSGFVVLLPSTIQCSVVVRLANQAPECSRYGQSHRLSPKGQSR